MQGSLITDERMTAKSFLSMSILSYAKSVLQNYVKRTTDFSRETSLNDYRGSECVNRRRARKDDEISREART